MSAWEVVAGDWREPNVIETFYSRAKAEHYADGMDGLGLRCYVREVDEDAAQGRSIVERDAIESHAVLVRCDGGMAAPVEDFDLTRIDG